MKLKLTPASLSLMFQPKNGYSLLLAVELDYPWSACCHTLPVLPCNIMREVSLASMCRDHHLHHTWQIGQIPPSPPQPLSSPPSTLPSSRNNSLTWNLKSAKFCKKGFWSINLLLWLFPGQSALMVSNVKYCFCRNLKLVPSFCFRPPLSWLLPLTIT